MRALNKSLPSTTVVTTTYLNGIDVSHWQSVIDWQQVKDTGVAFAFIKATDGISGVDSHYGMNAEEANGLVVHGAYHFFRQESASMQIKNFIKVCGAEYKLELPPALDVEVGPMDDTELANVWLMLDAMEQYAGCTPILYMDLANASKIVDDRFARFPLWLADYSTNVPLIPDSGVAAQWTFWQHTPQGHVQGVPSLVDLDYFNGTLDQLRTVGRIEIEV